MLDGTNPYDEDEEKTMKQEFDDLLKGKQSNDDKNLQQIFAEFYSRAKETDFKKPLGDKLNSARSSIGSMGSRGDSGSNDGSMDNGFDTIHMRGSC